jgi:hypothetical protein
MPTLPVDLSPLVLRAAGGCRLCLPDGRRWCRFLLGRLDFGFGELAPQVCRESCIGADGNEGRAGRRAVVGHEASIGRDDVARTQCRIISNGRGDKAEGFLAIACAAGDNPFPVRESGDKLRVALAVGRNRVLDAIAVVYLGCARRTKRAAGLRRTHPAMTLNWEIKSVAQAHAVDDACLGTGCFRAAQWGGRFRIDDRGIPEAAEQRLENVLSRGHSHGADQRRDGDSGHECAFDAAAQAGLATDQQSEESPDSAHQQSPGAPCPNKTFGGGRKYDLRVPGLRQFR